MEDTSTAILCRIHDYCNSDEGFCNMLHYCRGQIGLIKNSPAFERIRAFDGLLKTLSGFVQSLNDFFVPRALFSGFSCDGAVMIVIGGYFSTFLDFGRRTLYKYLDPMGRTVQTPGQIGHQILLEYFGRNLFCQATDSHVNLQYQVPQHLLKPVNDRKEDEQTGDPNGATGDNTLTQAEGRFGPLALDDELMLYVVAAQQRAPLNQRTLLTHRHCQS
jgi:hypothetical protein